MADLIQPQEGEDSTATGHMNISNGEKGGQDAVVSPSCSRATPMVEGLAREASRAASVVGSSNRSSSPEGRMGVR